MNPDAEEICDGIDNDCDELIDPPEASDASTWFEDQDGDGYGDPSSSVTACDAESGQVADSSDCDDNQAMVHPGATETCDGTDQDCDELIDEEAVDALTWYPDADGDGYGDPSSPELACDAPTGHIGSAGDCDDDDASAHPGAEEICDGLDQDCDELVDEDAVDSTSWYMDGDGDGFGSQDTERQGCDPASGEVGEAGDCDDDRASVHPDAEEVCDDGLDNDCVDGDASCPDSDTGEEAEPEPEPEPEPQPECGCATQDRPGGALPLAGLLLGVLYFRRRSP